MSAESKNVDPAQLAELDQQRAEGDANLDALVAKHREIISDHGAHVAIAGLVRDLDDQPQFIAVTVAALAVTRLAQQVAT